MIDRCFTLAVWSVADARYRPFQSSGRGKLMARISAQYASLVPLPHALLEVKGGSDDQVEAACARLPAPGDFDWSAVVASIRESVDVARFRDFIHPEGDPNR